MNWDQQFAEWINQHRWKQLDAFFILLTDTASIVAYSIPVLILIIGWVKKRKVLKVSGLQLLSSILLSTVLVTLIKNIVKRQRPYELDKIIEKLSVGGGFSFPSGHTADAVVMAVSVTLVITTKKWLLIPLWIWALLVAYSRIVLGVHFLTDLLGACLIASFCALLMNFLYKPVRERFIKTSQSSFN